MHDQSNPSKVNKWHIKEVNCSLQILQLGFANSTAGANAFEA